MIELFGQLLPNLAGLLISPGNIVVVVVILATAHGRRNTTYMLISGYIGAVALLWLGGLIGSSAPAGKPPVWEGFAELAIGLLFAYLVIPQFKAVLHPKSGAPAWMAKLDNFGPLASMGVGLYVGAFNVKSLPLLLHSGLTIGHAKLGSGEELVFILLFSVLVLVPVLVPLLISVLAGAEGTKILDAIRGFMTKHSANIMTVLFTVLAAIFIGKGIEILAHH